MTDFTDIHAHFVYGMDDGARTRADMEAMLDAAWVDGITTIYATPHVIPGIRPFDVDTFLSRLDEAKAYCREHRYNMTLYSGAEVLYTPALADYAANRKLLTLGDSNRVLLELVPDISVRELEAALERMERYGYEAVLAHVERYACFFHGAVPVRLKERWNVRYQVNANTVLNGRGFRKMQQIHSWFRSGLVDYVASDAHNTQDRPFQMRGAYSVLEQRFGRSYAGQITGITTERFSISRH